MAYASHRPGPPLAGHIDQIWFFEGIGRAPGRERLLPTGTVELVFNLREDEHRFFDPDSGEHPACRTSGDVVCGPHGRAFAIDVSARDRVLGVHFRPGGALPYLGASLVELTDRHVDLRDLWGPLRSELRERLLTARNVGEMFAITERILASRARADERSSRATRRRETTPAVAWAARELERRPERRIADLLAATGFGHDRLLEQFRLEIGLTPKRFARVQRFQRTLREIARRAAPKPAATNDERPGQRTIDWADLAVAVGYYDQAHLIHDFQVFSGLRPTAYLALRTEHLNHVPIAL